MGKTKGKVAPIGPNDPKPQLPPVITIVLQVVNSDKEETQPPEGDEDGKETEKLEEMTSAWRVLSFFVVVFVLPTILISVPLYARYHLYNIRTMVFTDGDMHAIHRGVSSFWCKGQRVLSNGTFEAYLKDEPRRVKGKYRTSRLSSELLLMQDEVEEWGMHLIKGSRFTFSTCARWPGGTLLVVQGEANMRRCFYREERFRDNIEEEQRPAQTAKTNENYQLVTPGWHLETNDGDEGGGEVLDNDVELNFSKQDLIRRLYSQSAPPNTTSPLSDTVNTTNNGEFLQLNSEDELTSKKRKGKKSPNKDKKKKRKNKEQKIKLNTTTQTEPTTARTKRQAGTSPQHLERLLVNRGSFFFNLNDTLDVTSGNSSISSSEEFLHQCSNTIVTLDLMPYINCKDIASVENDKGPHYLSYRVNQTDFYYFIFTSDNSIEANVISFRLYLERALYNVSDPLEACYNTSECRFPYTFMKSSTIIVDYNSNENVSKLEDLQTYELTSICQPRSIVYTLFIVMVPFIIILFAFR